MKRILDFISYSAINEAKDFGASPWTTIAEIKANTGLQDDAVKAAVKNLASGKLKSQLTKDDVKVLQSIVDKEHKFTKVDGGYGQGTINAVKNWQTQILEFKADDPNKLRGPDGIWGTETAKDSFSPLDKSPLKALAKECGLTDAEITKGGTSQPVATGSAPTSPVSTAMNQEQIDQTVEKIAYALEGSKFSEDTHELYRIFSEDIKNDSDLQAILKYFSSLKIPRSEGSTIGDNWDDVKSENSKNPPDKWNYPLEFWLRSLLDKSEIDKINSYISKYSKFQFSTKPI